MAKTFIVFDLFNIFQKVFNESKFARFIDFDLTESIHVGAGFKLLSQDTWRQKQLVV